VKEATLHIKGHRAEDIVIDGQAPVLLDAAVLLTKTRGEDFGHMLVLGSADTMGRMLVNLFRWSVRMDPQAAYTLERAAEDIVEVAKAHRGNQAPSWAEDGPESVN
jgi:hypothetical protein